MAAKEISEVHLHLLPPILNNNNLWLWVNKFACDLPDHKDKVKALLIEGLEDTVPVTSRVVASGGLENDPLDIELGSQLIKNVLEILVGGGGLVVVVSGGLVRRTREVVDILEEDLVPTSQLNLQIAAA